MNFSDPSTEVANIEIRIFRIRDCNRDAQLCLKWPGTDILSSAEHFRAAVASLLCFLRVASICLASNAHD